MKEIVMNIDCFSSFKMTTIKGLSDQPPKVMTFLVSVCIGCKEVPENSRQLNLMHFVQMLACMKMVSLPSKVLQSLETQDCGHF